MLMALSNRDGSFTGTFYMDNEGADESFAAFDDTPAGRDRCKNFCEKYYSEAAPHVGGMDRLVDQLVTNPTGVLGTVRTTKWAIKAKVLLIGDSCHAMVPFFGQGCNCGFEDVLWLSRFIDKHIIGDSDGLTDENCTPDRFSACFAAVEQERKPNAEAICDMALENFVEMRDKVGDTKFLAMKQLENKLENLYPSKFRSRYAMVCYGGSGNVSYANAKELGILQNTILETLCLTKELDLKLAESLIDEKVVPFQKQMGMDLSTIKH